MYIIVALAVIVFSVLAVTTRKILRAATYLLFTLFATAVIYFMLDYEFLGAVQIAVYAGGIVVRVVFCIQPKKQNAHHNPEKPSKTQGDGRAGPQPPPGAPFLSGGRPPPRPPTKNKPTAVWAAMV